MGVLRDEIREDGGAETEEAGTTGGTDEIGAE